MQDGHSHETKSKDRRLLAGIGLTAAVIGAPYYLPFLGIGSGAIAHKIANTCAYTGATGKGLAGLINGGLTAVPYIGGSLAVGGWTNAIASGLLGLGGTMLGNYVQTHYDRPGHVPWGKIIKYATLATSLLIALPSILSGVSMGLSFIGFIVGSAALASTVMHVSGSSLGLMGNINSLTSGAGLTGLASHLFTCGAAIIPLGLRNLLSHQAAPTDCPEKSGLRMQLVSAGRQSPGHPCALAFQLIDCKTGRALGADYLAIAHTQKLHTMIVDSALMDYQHVHPHYDAQRQIFVCEFTPHSTLPYTAWHDMTLGQTGENVKLRTALSAAHGLVLRPTIRPSASADANGVHATLDTLGPLRASSDGMLRVKLTDTRGNPLNDLEPIMGAYAHLVGFSADGEHMVHCHPLGEEPANAQARGQGQLQFHVTPEAPGETKFFLQIRRQGHEVVLPFGQRVLPSQKFADRVSQPHAAHGLAVA